MKSEYLLFNIIVAIGPLLSFLLFANIRKPKLVPSVGAILSTALGFIVWDIAVTGIFWNFNTAYILGPHIGGVPFEEVLFFITVPFACLLLWVNWGRVHDNTNERALVPKLLLLISIAITIWSVQASWYYTAIVSVVLALTIVLDYICRIRIFWKSQFHSFSLVVIFLTFVFNLYLTSRPVVLYNNVMKSNLNILTIPIEDFVYGLVLISCVIILYELIVRLRINR